MRSAILLLALCISFGAFAAKMTDRAPVESQAITAKSLKNSIVNQQMALAVNDRMRGDQISAEFPLANGMMYYTTTHPYSDAFFDASENSYKTCIELSN